MAELGTRLILTLNVGSSSLKFSVYRFGVSVERLLSGNLDRVGHSAGKFLSQRGDGTVLENIPLAVPNFQAALTYLFEWLPKHLPDERFAGIGHRLVHGGLFFDRTIPLSPETLSQLRQIIPFAPNHLPAALETLEATLKLFPEIPQFACFDTAFHRTIPAVARRYALPRSLHNLGIQRYGFHGLSYQYLLEELARLDSTTKQQRIILAHLGNGASLCGIVAGRSVDTTMGLTPMSGLVMGTRCGDLDPEIPLYLATEQGMNPSEIRELFSRNSGLFGVSGISSDVRDLLAVEEKEPAAKEALDLFCYSVRKGIAAMSAATGGLDTLVFSAGIGTYSPIIRARIADGLEYLGVLLDPVRNAANEPIISQPGAKVTIRVIPTDEELLIARETQTQLP